MVTEEPHGGIARRILLVRQQEHFRHLLRSISNVVEINLADDVHEVSDGADRSERALRP
jgi:hypothetical protein